jgi:putative FmdB family regulatory protein
MPTYEYECPKGHVFELFQKMSDPTRKKCPKCGKMAQRRISAGAGLLFKGEGFYITDNRPESYKEKAKFEIPGSSFAPKDGVGKAPESGAKESTETSSGAKEGGTSGAKGSSAKKGGPGGKKGRK